MSRVLYNRFVGIHEKVRPRSHGNFMPSLLMAEQLLREDANQPGTALSLMFLSDGRPSDNATGILRGNNTATSVAMCASFVFLSVLCLHGCWLSEECFNSIPLLGGCTPKSGNVAPYEQGGGIFW